MIVIIPLILFLILSIVVAPHRSTKTVDNNNYYPSVPEHTPEEIKQVYRNYLKNIDGWTDEQLDELDRKEMEKNSQISPDRYYNKLNNVESKAQYRNISTYPDNLQWFPCTRPDLPESSIPEQMIQIALNEFHVKWYREVSFYGLSVTGYSYPRYDILVETPNVGIGFFLIEYDSIQYHSSPDRVAMDNVKTQYCEDNEITLYRLNRLDYHQIPQRIEQILAEYNIYNN